MYNQIYILHYTYDIFSKFEANANKYKFVWKPVKFHKKLDVKIKYLLLEMNFEYKKQELIKE